MGSPIDFKSSGIHHQIPTSLPTIASLSTDSVETIRQSLSHLSPKERENWANSKDGRGKTPLAVAVEAHSPAVNKMDVIAFLVNDCGANPNIGDNDNWTPLYRAATETRTDALQFLMDHQADVNTPNNDGSTPLHRLVDRGSEIGTKAILYKGADVNVINCFGTPLAYAAKNGNIALARILLDAKADPNLIDDPIGFTPVELAANNRKMEMREFLASNGGQVGISLESKVHTPLSHLVQNGDEKAILESFIKGEKDKYGRTAAHYCAHHGKVDLLKKMQILGDIDVPADKGRTPLLYAVIKGHDSTVSYLIGEQGNCALNHKDLQGYSPLMWACQYNHRAIAKGVLERAKDTNMLNEVLESPDKFGWKAIHKAAQVGNVALLRMFVEEYKVDHAQMMSDGRTSLDLAKVTNAQEAITYLDSLSTKIPETFKKV